MAQARIMIVRLLRKPWNLRILGKQRLLLWFTYMTRRDLIKNGFCYVSCVLLLSCLVSEPIYPIQFLIIYGSLRNNTAEMHIFFCQSYLWRNWHVLSNLQVKQREVNQQCILTRMESFVRPIIRSLGVLSILLYGGRIWVHDYNGTSPGYKGNNN